MTRDEAIEIDFQISCKCKTWEDSTLEQIRAGSEAQIDSLVALGILKLEHTKAPKTREQLIAKARTLALTSKDAP